MEKAIEVRNLSKAYGETRAVDSVTFDVDPGEVFGLLGPNGAGKTTTVECLLGLRQPDSGRLCLLGVEIRKGAESSPAMRRLRERLGVQLQSTGLLGKLTVYEQVSMFARLFERALPAQEILQRVGLEERARASTRSSSGGQKQRLAVALALVNDPDLIFLDEPTTGLDPQARRGIWDTIRELKKRGKTLLLTTHYMEEAEVLCDRVAILDHGRIIEVDSPQALIQRHFRETAIEFVPLGEAPRALMGSLPGVGQTLFENGHVTLYSIDVPRTMAGLFDLVSRQAFAFKDITVRQASLEDVFLKLTGRRIRE